MNKTGIIIMAAGNSSRLGRPKQLLPYRGKTLLTHVVTEALSAALDPVIVVTGAFREEISLSLQGYSVDVVYNPRWEEGMASGIGAGLSKILSRDPGIEAVILAVCDQPYLTAGLLSELVEEHRGSRKGMVACSYADAVGTPALFGQGYFRDLSNLSGSEGAKKLLRLHGNDLVTIPFPQGNIDIDTEEDYQALAGKKY